MHMEFSKEEMHSLSFVLLVQIPVLPEFPLFRETHVRDLMFRVLLFFLFT